MLRVLKQVRVNLPLQIHVWGGLGSQLHACFLSHRIQSDFPKRKVSLIFHSSGVTRRQPEVLGLLGDLDYRIVDDFVGPQNQIDLKRRFRKELKHRFFSRFHFIESCNNEIEYKRLRWWTLQARGHYSNLNLSSNFSKITLGRMRELGDFSAMELDQISNSGAIHVRLGDLLEIEEKNPTNFQDVINVVRANVETLEKNGLYIYSDSPHIAKEILNEFNFTVLAKDKYQENAMNALVGMVDSSVFIGTGSKLSLWVAVFRFHSHFALPTFLPSYLNPILESLIPDMNTMSIINFYESIDY
jgi:hypothetical protein